MTRLTCDEATALWLTAPGLAELRGVALPEASDGDVVVRSLASGISRGTEALVFAGHVPESEWQRMRAPFQEGSFGFPVKYGYASVGLVEAGPAALLGQTVFCLFPHQDRYVVPAGAAVPLPHDLPPERGVLAANMETALNIVWDAAISPGDSVAVVGGGVVGGLVAYLAARMPGADVTLVDVNPNRRRLAESIGCAFAFPDEAPGDRDIVIHTSASSAGLATALGIAAFEAIVVEASWYGSAAVTIPLGGAFHSRRLRLVSSQVGHVAPSQRSRFSHRRRIETAIALLADPRLDVFVSGDTPFGSIASVYGAILADPETLCHRISYL